MQGKVGDDVTRPMYWCMSRFFVHQIVYFQDIGNNLGHTLVASIAGEVQFAPAMAFYYDEERRGRALQ